MSRFWSWMRNAGRRAERKSGRSLRRPLLGAECLEGRRMMAIVAYYDDGYRDGDDGWNFIADWAGINDSYHPELIGLHIVGTEQNDTVDIFESGGVLNIKLTNADGSQQKLWRYSIDVPNIFFHGGGGDDTFLSNAMARTFAMGDAGNDTLAGGNGEVHLFGGDNDDTLSAGPFAYGDFFGDGGNDTLYGTERENQMRGGNGIDYLYGRGGDDLLDGGSNDDVIYGGYGDDTIFGGSGDDDLYGDWGDDNIDGAAGDDFVDGGRGVDFLYGGDNTDHMYGGPDEDYDYIVGQRGGDVFHINFSGLADGGVNPDEIADYRASAGDRFDYSDSLNIVLEMVSRTHSREPLSMETKSADEVPEWLYDDVAWEPVPWGQPPLESLNGVEIVTLPLAGDSTDDAAPLTEPDVAEELPATDWTAADVGDGTTPDLGIYDDIFQAIGGEEPADDGAFAEPIDEATVDNYFADLQGSSSSMSGWSTNAIRSTGGWFSR
ncbi:MAG: calcium-binding protein [Pirellulales bacterium]